ncbi:flippase [Candidatus Contendibacter odensensis]|uniref:Polysaccharide biosynthesis protein n=1 Tax=Candidatus Contendobacter odensis Run_B_J11 TaxID=1400861 RepID=A0A7U7J3Z4_9GAMM|nr:flippase [Candidatus Contendobacter odensis]MBK8750221.1 flippase [Candidatus Competibacteraceae bacterium]CDH45678.1 putative Polysaccharide biosynthesis protein [Candidatus Contendobacter odensis Run_B_J11]
MNIRVGYNAFWNVLGSTLPLLAGVAAVPLLLHGLGNARLGVFTLAIGLIGFSGIFDLGLGRALTQMVASEQGKGTSSGAIAGLIRKALIALFLLGLFWGAVLWWSAPFLVRRLLLLEDILGQETIVGLHWIALSLPFALVSAGLLGIFEGLQRFVLINTIRVPLGTAFFMVPALIALGTPDIGAVIGALAATRIAAFMIWMLALLRVFNLFESETDIRLHPGPLMRFSGWLTVSNIVGPLMVYADRFYLASFFPPATVAFYTVPFDTAFRATTLPLAAVNAMFPALAHTHSQPAQANPIVQSAGQFMLLLWFPPILVAMLLAKEGLTLWLNQEFAEQAVLILQWLLLGVFLNGFAHIPYAVLQSAGRADITAKLHLLELPVYAGLIVGLVASFGILGAAIAWTVRIILDTVLLFLLAMRVENHHADGLYKTALLAVVGAFILGVAMTIHLLVARWIIAALVMLAATGIMWRFGIYLLPRLKENTGHAH